MFVDTTRIHLKAGSGGNGCNSFRRIKLHRRGKPDGGDGGNGGDVIIISDRNIHTLLDFQYKRHFKAQAGSHGSSNKKRGRNGEDCIIRVPPGTVIIDAHTREVLRDLSSDNQRVVICKGGKGGKGNSRFKPATQGQTGEEREVILELKLIAEVGIVGYPNAGKSTLISRISNTKPKVASYPFTTKEPMLGVVNTKDRDFVVADIPGLIKGAHLGKGLGHQFLRHIERTKVLLHLIDIAAVDGRDPLDDYETLNEELKLHDKRLIGKPQILALNKIDLPQAKKNIEVFCSKIKKRVYLISALEKIGLDKLVSGILEILCKTQ